jgi:hypothetical protein
MAKQGFQLLSNNPYVYQECDTGPLSAAFGLDNTNSLWKLKVLATAGATPTGTAHLTIDPGAAGNITITPNGAGAVILSPLSWGAVLANGTGVLSSSGAGSSGDILTSNGAGALPTFQPASSSGGIIWSVQTTDLNPMVVNHGYIANKAGLLTFTLPATCLPGKIFRVTGMNTAVGWHIAQNANQMIHWDGALKTTTGVGGYVESTDIYDAIEIVCSVADLEFIVISSKGNLTIV